MDACLSFHSLCDFLVTYPKSVDTLPSRSLARSFAHPRVTDKCKIGHDRMAEISVSFTHIFIHYGDERPPQE